MGVKLCVPTLICYDLCVDMIKSAMNNTIQPDEYIVIDNGNGGFKDIYDKSGLNLSNLKIIYPGFKSVAQTWNWLLNNLSGNLLIVNDDLILDPKLIETFLNYKNQEKDDKVVMYTNGNINAYSLFMMDSSIMNKMGEFDENFIPAYYEDTDHHYRMKLLGLKRVDIPGLNTQHLDSSTKKELDKRNINKDFNANFLKNQG